MDRIACSLLLNLYSYTKIASMHRLFKITNIKAIATVIAIIIADSKDYTRD